MKNILLLLTTFLVFSTAYSNIPDEISWQGYILDDQGNALDGNYNLTVKLYDAETGGNQLWTETQSVNIDDGYVNLILGKNTAINLDFEDPYWLELTVGSGNPLSRVKIYSVAYARTAANVEDKAITYDKLQDANGSSGTILMWNGSQWQETTLNDNDQVIGNEVKDATDATLVRNGAGTSGNPYTLDVAPLGIKTAELGNSSVITSKILNKTILDDDIADDQVVFSIGESARIKNDVYLVEGPNISIEDNTPMPGDIRISADCCQEVKAKFVVVDNDGDTLVIIKEDSTIIRNTLKIFAPLWVWGPSYHFGVEHFYEGLEVPLADEGGKVVINEEGIIVYDEEGNILIRFDENGSYHTLPEIFEDDIVREHPDGSTTTVDDNGITQKSADGKKTTTSTPEGFKTAEELDDGSVNETENTPTGTKNKTTDPEGNEIVKTNIGQDEEGNGILEIYDKDGNLIFKVDKDGSYHYVPEYFYHSTVVSNQAGDTVTVSTPGKTETTVINEDNSKNTTTVTDKGSDVTFTNPEGVENPVTKLGGDDENNGELELYDKNGNLIFKVDKDGSHHYVPEYYYNGIYSVEFDLWEWLVTGDGTYLKDLTTGEKIYEMGSHDVDGNGFFSLFDNDSDTDTENYLDDKGIETKGADGNTTGIFGTDEFGSGNIELYDSEGNLIFKVDENGSYHYVEEQFPGGIKIPLVSGGYILLDDNGMQIFDSEGTEQYSVDDSYSYHSIPEYFPGGLYVGGQNHQSNGGWYFNDGNSNWIYMEYYNPSGTKLLDYSEEMGLTFYDYSGSQSINLGIYSSNFNVPVNLNSETTVYDKLIVPTSSGGKLILDDTGLHIQNSSDLVITELLHTGESTHGGLETFNGGWDVPLTDGGSILAGSDGLRITNSTGGDVAHWGPLGTTLETSVTFNSGLDVSHNYDPLGRVIDVKTDNGTTSGLTIDNNGTVNLGREGNDAETTIHGSVITIGGTETQKVQINGGDAGDIVIGDNMLPNSLLDLLGEDINIGDGNTNSVDITGITNILGPNTQSTVLDIGGDNGVGNEWINDSDIRLKQNIELIPNALDKILKLNGYYYTWKHDENNNKQIGVIAQEVNKYFPEIVYEDNEGYLGVAYPKLTAILIEAMKEQQKLIEEQQKKIESLENQVNSISELEEQNKLLKAQYLEMQKIILNINDKLDKLEGIKTVNHTEGD